MTSREYPILEFDPARKAVIEPTGHVERLGGMPQHGVICFFQNVIDHLLARGRLRQIAVRKTEMGHHAIYECEYEGRRLALFHPGVGAPLAARLLEEAIALGCEKFIACGGAGVLDGEIARGYLIVPTAAVRDDGTSYHYAAPGREIAVDPHALACIEQVLQQRQVDYLLAKTWTTDAFYRETEGKVRRRRDEGCLTVEMETATLFAVAQFRRVPLAQILYGGDDVSGRDWDARDWDQAWETREQLVWLAAEACLKL